MTLATTVAPAADPGTGLPAKKWILAPVAALLAGVVAAYFVVGHHRRVVS